VRIFYKAAALWIGLANFLFVGAVIAWLVDLLLRFFVPAATRIADRPYIAGTLLVAAITTAVYGLVNARIIRLRRVTVKLSGLPESWRGRQALLVSDLHLGHVNGLAFARRIAGKVRGLNPAIVFLPGDMFDGGKVDPLEVAAPLLELKPPLGMYFVGGNHEEFGGAAHFEDALRAGGIRVLHNECAVVDGVRIVGVAYGHSTYPLQMRTFLEGLRLKEGPPSILLNHVPSQLTLAEHAGVSLQLSGHTHGGGQLFPFNFITRRAFGKFTYGLQTFGEMQVYTSSGAGTWGPPMRVGTHSEIVLLTFA
jgi:predicted MPP superfamily phosphohydrolase